MLHHSLSFDKHNLPHAGLECEKGTEGRIWTADLEGMYTNHSAKRYIPLGRVARVRYGSRTHISIQNFEPHFVTNWRRAKSNGKNSRWPALPFPPLEGTEVERAVTRGFVGTTWARLSWTHLRTRSCRQYSRNLVQPYRSSVRKTNPLDTWRTWKTGCVTFFALLKMS